MTDPLGHDASVPAFLRRHGPGSAQARTPDEVLPVPPRRTEETLHLATPPPRADPPFEPTASSPRAPAAAARLTLPTLELGEAVSVLDRPCRLPSLKKLDALLTVRVPDPKQQQALAAALIPHSLQTLTAMKLMDLLSAASVDDTHPCTLLGYVLDDTRLLSELYFELAGVSPQEALQLDTPTMQRFQQALQSPLTEPEAMQTLLHEAPRNAGLLDLMVARLAMSAQPPLWLAHRALAAFGPLASGPARALLQPTHHVAQIGSVLQVVRALGPFARPLLPDLVNHLDWDRFSPVHHLLRFQTLCAAGPTAQILDARVLPLVRKLAEEPPVQPDETLRDDCQIRARALLSLADV